MSGQGSGAGPYLSQLASEQSPQRRWNIRERSKNRTESHHYTETLERSHRVQAAAPNPCTLDRTTLTHPHRTGIVNINTLTVQSLRATFRSRIFLCALSHLLDTTRETRGPEREDDNKPLKLSNSQIWLHDDEFLTLLRLRFLPLQPDTPKHISHGVLSLVFLHGCTITITTSVFPSPPKPRCHLITADFASHLFVLPTRHRRRRHVDSFFQTAHNHSNFRILASRTPESRDQRDIPRHPQNYPLFRVKRFSDGFATR